MKIRVEMKKRKRRLQLTLPKPLMRDIIKAAKKAGETPCDWAATHACDGILKGINKSKKKSIGFRP